MLHLGRCFARERDGNDFLGLLDESEQAQVALDKKLCFPGTCRRLYDERARFVERVVAGSNVVCQ